MLPTRRATLRVAQRLAAALAPGDLVLLEGDLGAGKTYFARAVGRALGIPHDVAITSPTFTLVHEYETPRGHFPLVHADLYRLADPDDLHELGLREARAAGAVVMAEWAARFAEELGDDGILLQWEMQPGGQRRIRTEARGPRGALLVRAARGEDFLFPDGEPPPS